MTEDIPLQNDNQQDIDRNSHMNDNRQNLHELISLQDCPYCGGAALLEEEQGWCFYVTCVDCDRHTAEVEYRTPEGREEAARGAAYLWNLGKVLTGVPGE